MRGAIGSKHGLICAAMVAVVIHAEAHGQWKPLAEDGLHDTQSPAMALLQEPGEALSVLPADTTGNNVRWIEALRNGSITPRTNIFPETKIEVLDLDILMKRTATLPFVLFPHRAHTEWLDCKNCHPKLFAEKAGATKIGMLAILQGKKCGRCHGAVSFPLTECNRCHSIPQR